jgi:Iap family predicted aminopeptidase
LTANYCYCEHVLLRYWVVVAQLLAVVHIVVITIAVVAVYMKAACQCLRIQPIKGVCTAATLCVEQALQEQQMQCC